MAKYKFALVGAGSRSFGPGTIKDLLLSRPLAEHELEIVLMDRVRKHLGENEAYARWAIRKLGRKAKVRTTTDLNSALDGASAVVSAIEVDRYLYWAQDFHVPRRYGFRQVYGENGGPGGIFHALRNMGPTVAIARAMEKKCPGAPLLNYTNPEPKLCEAVCRLTGTKIVGLCDGVFMGGGFLSEVLGKPVEDLDLAACGLNHITWFQKIRDRRTGEDLYPRLKEIVNATDPLADWHELALPRILLIRFGLWPAPAPNHYGEYLGWAHDFVAYQAQYYYDPMEGQPWETGKIPEFVYSLSYTDLKRPMGGKKAKAAKGEPERKKRALVREKHTLAAAVIEGLVCGETIEMPGVNVPNCGAIPNLADDTVVEVPATVDASGVHPHRMEPLPEGIAAILRLTASIHVLLVEAFAEKSKNKLVQALLLDPTCPSYRAAAELADEMLRLQRGLLPPLK